jgi:hypothetical protein
MSTKKEVNSWDGFIEDARAKLAAAKTYVRSMSAAVKILERNKANNVPVPSSKRRPISQRQQHSV